MLGIKNKETIYHTAICIALLNESMSTVLLEKPTAISCLTTTYAGNTRELHLAYADFFLIHFIAIRINANKNDQSERTTDGINGNAY